MSKLQLLYEKFMRIAYIFGGIFFVLSLIDFSAAMMTGAFSCGGGTCGVGDQYPFYKVTLLPLVIITLIFIVAGFIFFKLAHKESDLLSVSDYKKSLEQEQASDEIISREELYEKLRRGNRKVKEEKDPIFKRIWAGFTGFFRNIGDKFKETMQSFKTKSEEKKEDRKVAERIEEEKLEQEKLIRARTKLNKTALILLLSKNTSLTQNDSRLFVNALLETIKDSVIDGEEVKISKFGRFEKVHIDAHTEIDPETDTEIKIEEHNTVEFFAYKNFLEKLNGKGVVVEEEPEIEKEPVQEEVVEETPVEEPVQEEVVEETPAEEPVQEEVVEETPVEEPVQEEVVEETPVEEPVQEEVVEETPVKEPVQEEVVEETPAEEPVQEEVEEKTPTEEPKQEKLVEEKPKKPAKPKPAVKTKKQIIELMDETTDLSKNKANKFLKFFAEVVKEQLAAREEVELEGIGFFTTIEMPAKEAVNPQTNEKIIVPAHHQVRLRFDDELKDKMNE